MFPMSITGEFKISRLQDEDVNLVLNRVEQELAAVRATNVSRTANRITFKGGIFRFVSNWNLLVPIGYGKGNKGSKLQISKSEKRTEVPTRFTTRLKRLTGQNHSR